MARCNQCKVEIRDNVSVCPLCGCVLDDVTEQKNRYPNIRHKDRKIDLVTRIYLFAALLVEAWYLLVGDHGRRVRVCLSYDALRDPA